MPHEEHIVDLPENLFTVFFKFLLKALNTCRLSLYLNMPNCW